jgi:hypothetical protein
MSGELLNEELVYKATNTRSGINYSEKTGTYQTSGTKHMNQHKPH